MKKLIALIVFVAAIVGGYYFVSPWLAMNNLREAALSADSEALDDVVDFAAVRASMKDRVQTRIDDETGGGLLGQIGSVIADKLADGAIDLAVSPKGLSTILVTGGVAGAVTGGQPTEVTWDVEREGFSRFRGVGTKEDGSATPVMIFERRGLGWEVVDIEL